MSQVRKDYYPVYKTKKWQGRFHFIKTSCGRAKQLTLCTFDEAEKTSSGKKRSNSAVENYIRQKWEDKKEELIKSINYIPDEDKKVILLKDAIKEFNSFNISMYSPTHKRELTRHFKFWIKKLGNIPIDKITQKEAVKIRNRLKCADSYKNRHYSALSTLLTACVEDHEFINYNPLWKLKKKYKLQENNNVGKALSILQLQDLLKEAKNIFDINDDYKDDRKRYLREKNNDFYLLILMEIYTGARMQDELIPLKWSDYDGTKLTFRKTKNKKDRVCPIWGDVKYLLDTNEKKRDKIFMFVDYRKKWNKLKVKANISNFTPHDLRHSTVTWLLENNVPKETVAEIVGHNSDVTKIYNHIRPEHLIESVKTLKKQLKVK